MLLPSRLVPLLRNEPPLLLVAEINRCLAAVDFCFAFFGGFMSRSCCAEPPRTCGRLAQPIVPQQAAALRDFDPAHVRFGSFASEAIGAGWSRMSGLPQKPTCPSPP